MEDLELHTLSGFGNHFSSEALPGALPVGQNNPQKAPYGLVGEQLSGTAFTVSRKESERSWLYRIRPSVVAGEFKPYSQKLLKSPPFQEVSTPPTQFRWKPMDYPAGEVDFLDGLTTICGNGQVGHHGCLVHLYAITSSMSQKKGERFFYNSDGDFLIVPEKGSLEIKTEFGALFVMPTEIVVIPRGIKFQVNLKSSRARGYVCENYGAHFKLPDLGPIGSNGLANPRDFLSPVASFEDCSGRFELLTKFQGALFSAELGHHPFDVVAWHGNYVPYKYDLKLFNTMNTVSYDHPDPSIFTVLTSPTDHPGVANIDFVIFPPRWMVAEHTFRPPYYHRNIMSEYMGLVQGEYDAKSGGFVPGGGSLHNCMSAHGPDAKTYERALEAKLVPERYEDTLAFMFETSDVFQVTPFALDPKNRDMDYLKCWQGFKPTFNPKGA